MTKQQIEDPTQENEPNLDVENQEDSISESEDDEVIEDPLVSDDSEDVESSDEDSEDDASEEDTTSVDDMARDNLDNSSDDTLNDSSADDEVTITIRGEEPQEEKRESRSMRDLRLSHRRLKKQKRELQEQLDAVSGSKPKAVELGAKPKLDDYEYDTDEYENALDAWYNQKKTVDDQQREQQRLKNAQTQEWQNRLDHHGNLKSKLKVRDYEEVELLVQEALSKTQQGMIVQGAEDSAKVMYVLGKNPKKLKELSEIKDPVKFAFTVSKLETRLKVTPKKRPSSNPESTIRGSGGSGGNTSAQLEKLRKDAEKTGDMTQVVAFRREMKRNKTKRN